MLERQVVLQVWALDEGGEQYWGDVLIGADGIFSKVRRQLVGDSQPTYSGYTCYTGISHFVCPDIDTVAYRVFLGNRQYFVSSDVGDGMMQARFMAFLFDGRMNAELGWCRSCNSV